MFWWFILSVVITVSVAKVTTRVKESERKEGGREEILSRLREERVRIGMWSEIDKRSTKEGSKRGTEAYAVTSNSNPMDGWKYNE